MDIYLPGMQKYPPADFDYCRLKSQDLLQTAYTAAGITGTITSISSGYSPKWRLGEWTYLALKDSGKPKILRKTLTSLATAQLAFIVTKEVLKAVGVMSFFFHPFFHRPKNFIFLLNSPLTILPLLLSSRFCDMALFTEESEAAASPWPAFWDLLLEDLPQLFLPSLMLYLSNDRKAIAIVSMTGTYGGTVHCGR